MKQFIMIGTELYLVVDVHRLEANKFTKPFKYNGLCEVGYEERSNRRGVNWLTIENPGIMSYEEAIKEYPEYFV